MQDNGSFCCLGVLCDLYDPDGWGHPVREYNDREYEDLDTNSFFGAIEFPPEEVQKWAGMKTDVGLIGVLIENKRTLTELNDSGKTFEEIAVIIKEYWQEL